MSIVRTRRASASGLRAALPVVSVVGALIGSVAQPRLDAPLELSNVRACGCFALPSPASPVVQAGERILFAREAGQIVAHIQIQYQGAAEEFGWLVPLPAVPTLALGTEELFRQLDRTTSPSFPLTTTRQFCDGSSRSTTSFGCGASSSASAPRDTGSVAADAGTAHADGGAVVETSSIGPYDYAVLKADDRAEMLKWLEDNRFFVPSGTDRAVEPYIRPGAFFLALKLRAGQSAGDIVPIVLRYASDLPMIPITLTQVGAVPNMGVLVWVLGGGRAIPRNYHHVVLDDLPIWFNQETYSQLVTRAVQAAPGHHGFVTDYAGTSRVMSGFLYPGRFGTEAELAREGDPASFLRYLRGHGYTFDATLVAILGRHIPLPSDLAARGLTPAAYYFGYDLYGPQAGTQPPAPTDLGARDGGGAGGVNDGGTPAPADLDAAALAAEIFMRVVAPIRGAAALFDRYPYLTRLYTTLSPEDMNVDPVFSENRSLPSVGLARRAEVTIPCQGRSTLATDSGLSVWYDAGLVARAQVPAALRVEILADEGPPQVVTDNLGAIEAALSAADGERPLPGPSDGPRLQSSRGCSVRDGFDLGQVGGPLLMLGALAWVALRARRRPR